MFNSVISNKNTILTFGYGNRKDYNLFLEYLNKFNVAYVIDIRLSPRAWSRKWYGDAIEKLCISKNISYVSRKPLGNTSGNSHWIPPSQAEAEQTLSEVAEMLEVGSVLLLCAEMDSSRCHRVEVASKLQVLTNKAVKHLK